jgi:hypothetical protein
MVVVEDPRILNPSIGEVLVKKENGEEVAGEEVAREGKVAGEEEVAREEVAREGVTGEGKVVGEELGRK